MTLYNLYGKKKQPDKVKINNSQRVNFYFFKKEANLAFTKE